ncbi:AfsA-related hotdog domain-containing protein [Streptomyces sp. NPDC050619]|uniref:AfsA-related hotdog domain-containing protein n=1 Tax=Streptomyces sp. NPDC050619 TaxID=3157214 RepID=UPI00343E8204
MTVSTRAPSARDTLRSPGHGAELVVDEGDPFFFDHPLDHVPAMLLLDGAVRAARALDGPLADRPEVTRLWMQFDRFCEKDRPVRLRLGAAADPGHPVSIRVVQDGTDVCLGGLACTPGAVHAPLPASSPAGGRPPHAAPALVHKRAVAQILVGPLHRTGPETLVTPVLEPAPGAETAAVHPLTVLVEACRQASIMILHAVHDVPLDHQFILSRLDVDLSPGPAWAGPPVLCCRPRRVGRDHTVVCELLDGEERRGTVTCTGRTVPAAVYRRLREATRKRPAATGPGPRGAAR